MAVWLIRAGSYGEYEEKFISEKRVYVTWEMLDVDLSKLADRPRLVATMTEYYPDAKPKTIRNWSSQIWPFAHEIKKGDLVVLPLKRQRAIQVGEVVGGYCFVPNGPDPFFHWLPVEWIGEAIPRANFGKDLLASFGAFMTICRIQRNNAETRLAAMRSNGWKPETVTAVIATSPVADEATEDTDLEELARDQIVRLISARFKGHKLTRLVEAILQAQGYTTYLSPEGADGGADILAGAGPLGFGAPRLCVEVKSESTPIDRPTVDKLIGAVHKFNAQEGLFVAWGGFKSTVQKELAASFFHVRLWTQKELLEQFFVHYDRLDEDLRAELPLKRIWTVAAQDEE
ncbi:MAG: restriction endonuclease [Deltaproteobacteria bacterium]|nr:restriction endonuclease [Deltaproteobacteria bacterium]MBF0527180.1 restriction endonuclease [Deltaproteobacteria bacterium]